MTPPVNLFNGVEDCRFAGEDAMTKLQKDHLMILLESM
jgi:hypothetical protein